MNIGLNYGEAQRVEMDKKRVSERQAPACIVFGYLIKNL